MTLTCLYGNYWFGHNDKLLLANALIVLMRGRGKWRAHKSKDFVQPMNYGLTIPKQPWSRSRMNPWE